MSDNARVPAAVVAANTVAFTLSFAVWVIFGPSIRGIAKELHLAPATAAFIKTLPVLVGSVMRIPIGVLTDRIGARLTFPILMLASAGSLYGLADATSATALIVNALVMGMVGTTFVVGVQSVSSWTPPSRRGFALGIFGAGNVGTALTTFGLPLAMASLGWRGAFRLYGLVTAAGAVGYWFLVRNVRRPMMKDASRQGPPLDIRTLLSPLTSARAWRFGLYYLATFGVFVAATLTITDVYVDGYRMPLKTAGLLATTFTCAASLCRIPGGRLADRFGARQVTRLSLAAIVCFLTPVCLGPPLAMTVTLVFAAGIAMGFGMAAVFRYIPDYFPQTVGAVGGAVGALGGLGGFFLPQLGDALKPVFGAAYVEVLPLAAAAFAALLVQQWMIARSALPASDPEGAGLSALRSAVAKRAGATPRAAPRERVQG